MSFFVTFATMRSEGALNLFGHSCILLSQLEPDTNKVRVVDVWAYYGISSEAENQSWSRWLKKTLLGNGLDLDFSGNHAFLRHEEPRYLEMNSNYYLVGSTFELTLEQFQHLNTLCQGIHDAQHAAISDAARALGLQPKAQKIRQYSYEDDSRKIFEHENGLAHKEQRAARLQPFLLQVSWECQGPHIRDSRSCKSLILSLLAKVLTKEQIDTLTEQGKHPSLPRLSGAQERLYFHCSGPLSSHYKSSGQTVYYHQQFGYGTHNDVACYFTIRPQLLDGSDDIKHLFMMNDIDCERAKSVVGRSQRLWWALVNGGLSEESTLVQLVRQTYVAFADISRQKSAKRSNLVGELGGKTNSNCFFTAHDSSKFNNPILKQITEAERLFSSIYQAIETDNAEQSRLDGIDDAVCMVASLSTQTLKDLCTILGKKYPESFWNKGDAGITPRCRF